MSPRRRRGSPSYSRSRSRSPSQERPPLRKGKESKRRESPSRSRSRSPRPTRRGDDKMDIDRPSVSGSSNGAGELKIKGQAELERRKSKWEEGPNDVRILIE